MKTGVEIDRGKAEDCHWIKAQDPKKAVIDSSRYKNANKIRMEKNKLKGKKLSGN